MAKRKQNNSISPAGKIGILLVIFGIPILFAFSSWGLSKLFDIAPYAVGSVLVLVATIYTAQTSGLMYDFYQVDAPVLRFVPCICELTLIDIKYHLPCYILYVLALIFGGCMLLPYGVLSMLGDNFATSAPFYCMVAALLCLIVIQIIKGIGIMGCMKDIGEEWHKQTHADVGAFSKFSIMGFIPFVRVMALYALNKPLSTMVSFMGVTVEDGEQDNEFVAEE